MATQTSLPPDVQTLAQAHRLRQQQLAAAATQQTNRLWAFLAAMGWAAIAPQMLATVRAALLEAARGAQDYVSAAVRMWGREPDPAGTVAERTFALTASDGRPLGSLLAQPSLEVAAFINRGMVAGQAREIGRRHLQRIVVTQVADAARVSTGVAVVNDRHIKGYVRHLTLPSCNRCIVLAGRWYRWSAGFERHPQCDCVHIPAAVSAEPISPKAIFDGLSDEERRAAGWSGHDVQAIDDGADLSRVTNAKRELRTLTVAGRPVKTTGVRFRGQRARVRLTPEAIYADAERLDWSRDETIAQLKRFGYIL